LSHSLVVGQGFQFLFSPLAPCLSSSKNNYKIKHITTEVVIFCPYFLTGQTRLKGKYMKSKLEVAGLTTYDF
jgi:hypothetical protein